MQRDLVKMKSRASHFLRYPIFDRVIYTPKICRNIRNRNNIPFRFSYCAIENAIIFLWRRRFRFRPCFERETAISTRVPRVFPVSHLRAHADLISYTHGIAISNSSLTLISRQVVSIRKRVLTFMKINWFSCSLELIKYFKAFRVLWNSPNNVIDTFGFWVAYISGGSE